MNTVPMVLYSRAILAAIALLLLVAAIRLRRGEEHVPNYRVFFTLGIIWLPMGIATENPGLWGVGAAFLMLGLLNRHQWRKARGWAELSENERRFKIALIGGLVALSAVVVTVYYLVSAGVVGG